MHNSFVSRLWLCLDICKHLYYIYTCIVISSDIWLCKLTTRAVLVWFTVMRTKLSRLEASCDPYVSGQSMVTLRNPCSCVPMVAVHCWCAHFSHSTCWISCELWVGNKNQFILETTPVFLQLLSARTRWLTLEQTLSLIEPPSLDRNLYIRWYTDYLLYNCRFLKCTMETNAENPSSLVRKGLAKHHFL